jgi:HEAT repeat protein
MESDSSLEHILSNTNKIKYSDLAKLSGITAEVFSSLSNAWATVPVEQRRTIIERMINMAEANIELDFTMVLKHSLKDTDPKVRSMAVNGLWECGDRAIIKPLITLLSVDPHKDVRASAATALGKFCILAQDGKLLTKDSNEIRQVLLELLENKTEEPEVWRRALEAAAVFDTSEISKLIYQAYGSKRLNVRVSAVFAMGKTADRKWLSLLMEAVSDEEPAMRYEAAVSMGELAEDASIPYLSELINNDDTEIQLASIKALSLIDGPAAKSTLQKHLSANDEILMPAIQSAISDMSVEGDPFGFRL